MRAPAEPLDLMTIARQHGFRVVCDPDAPLAQSQDSERWLVSVPGKHGTITVHSDRELRATSSVRRCFARLATVPTVRVLEQDDDEIQVAFAPEHVGAVASILKVRYGRTKQRDGAE